MPLYEFKCSDCGIVFEVRDSYENVVHGHKKCTNCGSRNTAKLIGTPAIIFKGDGFYKTDNSSKDSRENKS